MKLTITTLALSGALLAGCGTTTTERAATGGLAGAAVGAAVGNSVTGALIGGAAGAAIGAATTPDNHRVDRRQYYDERARRYLTASQKLVLTMKKLLPGTVIERNMSPAST